MMVELKKNKYVDYVFIGGDGALDADNQLYEEVVKSICKMFTPEKINTIVAYNLDGSLSSIYATKFRSKKFNAYSLPFEAITKSPKKFEIIPGMKNKQ